MRVIAAPAGDEDMTKRDLYRCFHAKVKGNRIYCTKGHPLSLKSSDGSLDIKRLIRGEPLALGVCQECSDFDCMGPPIPEEDRGWVKHNRMVDQARDKVALAHNRSKGNNAG